MSVNSLDILDFAKDCVGRKDEIGYRNAVARAYYSAYHHVIPCLNNGPKDSHQGLIDYLLTISWKGNEPFSKPDLIGIGYALQTLKAQRVISDYCLDDEVTESQSATAIKTVEKLMKRCADMTKSEAS
ncbi:hypothetical protein NUKP24_21030 [Klebsiella variicola]|uniref:hypothetical protein n=1 Tax=Klebsiella variicola TaxID=244366 RepID=UPI002181CC65|nr:hypothetical protein [Klebsiella variicola]GKJ27964.1 hypothetical protein NUKP24_21030 [Klebsiella variicola]HCI9143659.1 hypothetical protein [Klebsiella variicola]